MSSSSSLNITELLQPGNCYSNRLSIGTPILDYNYSCPLHFFCPNTTESDPFSIPQICQPSVSCQLDRLAVKLCANQGKYEPQLCPKGNYCPDYTTRIKCPEGSFCPVGSIAPRSCPPLSSCPEGSIVPRYHGGVIICLIIDVILLCFWGGNKLRAKWEREKAIKVAVQVTADEEAAVNESTKLQHSSPEPISTTAQPPPPLPTQSSSLASPDPQLRPTSSSSRRRGSVLPNAPLGITDASAIKAAVEEKGILEEEDEEEENEEARLVVKTPKEEVTRMPTSKSLQGLGKDQVVVAGKIVSVVDIGKSTSPAQAMTRKQSKKAEEDEEAESPLEKFQFHGSTGDISSILNFFQKGMNNQTSLKIDFRFEDLGLSLPDGRSVLQGVTGTILSKKLTAIMGPSGAGKTTFMNVLMGKVNRTRGKLLINGLECEMSKYKKIIGYVPQEDIMLRELTVRENIAHSARVRLPASWSSTETEAFIDGVLDVLNLSHVQHNPIGDESTRGVSGGQRKRVNIGMELASVPLALFLDEPTSGLDSTAALKVAEILKRVASIGLTVVAVIHQPRFEIFQQFDEILMIAPGGRTAYLGPTGWAIEYFEGLGFYFDPRANPADILMDILSDKGVNKRQHLTPMDLVKQWEKDGIQWVHSRRGRDAPAQDLKGEKKEGWEDPEYSSKELESSLTSLVNTRGAPFLMQSLHCHNRYLIQQFRKLDSLGLEVGVASLAGALMGIAVMGQSGELFVGVVVSPFTLISSSTLTWLIPQLGLLIGIATGLAGAPAGVKVFGEEKTVYWREAASGHSPFAYFLGKIISSSYRFLITSLHFASIFIFLATPAQPFPTLFVIILAQFFCVYGLATVVSMVVKREDAALLAVVTCLFSAVFCGYGPSVEKARSWGVSFIWDISYARWCTEAFYSQEVETYVNVFDIQSAAKNYGYQLGNVTNNLGFAFLIGVVLRLIALVLMLVMNRDKQR
ncbi:hypothetical protein HDV05_001581 [Chytridiales sp. JEL 0842]|nr:hypothetical protein HDV05_001581 [Chytridiales sp. JEL 0842]